MCLLHEDPVRPSYQTTLLSSNLPFPRKGLASGDRTQAVRLAQQTLSPQSHFTSPEQFVIRISCYMWPNVTGSKRWHSRPQKLKCGFTEFDWAGLALFVGFKVSLGLWKRQQYSNQRDLTNGRYTCDQKDVALLKQKSNHATTGSTLGFCFNAGRW